MTLGASWLWPDVSTGRNASSAIEEAVWVALLVSAFNLVFAAVDLMRTGEWRTLVLYLLSRAYFWIITGSGEPGDPCTHRVGLSYCAENVCVSQVPPRYLPSVEDSFRAYRRLSRP
jgi:hypothetical protein